jgi:DNA polymerase III alpha subunit
MFQMTEKYSWYKADMRRREIAKKKRLKADRYVEEMNKRANESTTSKSS